MARKLTQENHDALIDILEKRFKSQMHLHEGFIWEDVLKNLNANPAAMVSLSLMEETEGEPDVVDYDKESKTYLFFDTSPESPKGRRSICYDHEALNARKANKPENSAINMAEEMGIDVLTEAQYRMLQSLGEFDLKTSSWLKTPRDIRHLGGAIFGDRRYNTIFLYHNGADSYYGARGFRGWVAV